MSEHMAGRTSGSVPTLTDHFKQALSMTRSQLQAGPSALSSASQMGVNGLNLNVPGTMNPMGSVSVPAAQSNAALNTLANIHTRPDLAYGAGQGQGVFQNPSESPSGFAGAIQSYGKWILLLLIVVAGVGAYFWWKKRQSKSQNNITEEMQMPGRRPIHRSSGGMGGGLGTGMSIPIVSGGGGGGNVGGGNVGGGSNAPPTFNPSRFQPGPSQHTQSPQPIPENLRENEQRGAARGAEFSNPSMVSHMMPMSTRVKPAEQTQNLPPQDIANPQPPRTPQNTQQSLPSIQSAVPSVSQPPVNLPISQQPNQPSNQPSNQAPNQQVNYPVGQPSNHVPELPISPQPSQPLQASADPNFTVV